MLRTWGWWSLCGFDVLLCDANIEMGSNIVLHEGLDQALLTGAA